MSQKAAEDRLKRIRMRSWRRGIKEMDIVLGSFADHGLATLSAVDLDIYERMLEENDHDLYAWICGRSDPPEQFSALLLRIGQNAGLTG